MITKREEREGLPASFLLAVGAPILYRLLQRIVLPGEILVLYSILGIVLIPVCKLSNKVVLAIAVVLMLQPMEWGKFMYALIHPEYVASKEQWLVHLYADLSVYGRC